MLHRPVPDIAVLDTGDTTWSEPTADGITRFGILQSCIRPGEIDNSHIGNNGTPIPAVIGGTEVFIDIIHGVHNRQLKRPEGESKWRLTYLPYLRVLDATTGDCLYYSKEPVLEVSGGWEEHVVDGEWVRKIDHLDAVMFAGGQVERMAGRIGLDDEFHTYIGVGDTAIARAIYRLRDLMPNEVIEDISSLGIHRIPAADAPVFVFPGVISGWHWSIEPEPARPGFGIVRHLRNSITDERAFRPVALRPGYFDAHGIFFDGCSAKLLGDLGWVLVYRGIRCVGEMDGCLLGYGLLLMDPENPERILYRSHASLDAETKTAGLQGWQQLPGREREYLEAAEHLIPENVREEIRHIHAMRPLPSDMTKWLKLKAHFPNE